METVIADNISGTISVTDTLRNSHCIMCGKAFSILRVGKLYCSARCKQFGYNHKEKIIKVVTGISAKQQIFYIDEYQFYEKQQRKLRLFNELSYKQNKWEHAETEIRKCQNSSIQANSFTWNTYISKKLTDSEEGVLCDLDNEIELEIRTLNLRELSIEQWSFIKSLYPEINGISFCELVSSLSRDFINQLNLNSTNNNTNEHVIIKNKYINHCNLIATGVIRFEMKQGNNKYETN